MYLDEQGTGMPHFKPVYLNKVLKYIAIIIRNFTNIINIYRKLSIWTDTYLSEKSILKSCHRQYNNKKKITSVSKNQLRTSQNQDGRRASGIQVTDLSTVPYEVGLLMDSAYLSAINQNTGYI